MTRKGCGIALLIGIAGIFALGVWANFAFAYERTRAASPDGGRIATAYIDGMPLTRENERIHVWRAWRPHFRWLGCQVLEAVNESPTRLTWLDTSTLLVEHGFRSDELISTKNRCGNLRVIVKRSFKPYS